MKKRIAILLVLLLVVSVCVGALVGCDAIISLNEERDAKQVVATVNYAGQTAEVYKYELAMSFNSYAYIYNAYYGMTYQQAADYLLQSLAQRELLVLFAKDTLVKMDDPDASAVGVSTESLLSAAEKDRAIRNVNEDVLSAINSALASLISANTSSSSGSGSDKGEYEEYNGDDAITVRFDSQKGSEVERQRIKNGTEAFEPTDPTREGYTFYGWYTDKECTDGNKFDFDAPVTLEEGQKSITLYAKWAPYLEPRPVREAAEEDPDADYDPDDNTVELSARAFGHDDKLTEEYRALIMNGEEELETLSTYSEAKKKEYLEKYLDDAAEDVADDFAQLRTSYDYYLENEMNSLLITRLERKVGESASVTQEEVEARFDSMVAANKEAYGGNRTSYESALTSSLASSYYHEYTSAEERYGFVINILLRLPDEDLAELTGMVNDGSYQGNKSVITQKRDELLSAMEINVSNPNYDPDYTCDKHSCSASSDCDPMTCPEHECAGTMDEGSDLNKIVEFVYDKETGEAEIKRNATACPSMAYLPETVPAFSTDDEVTGIVDQIYASFEAVTQAVEDGMPHVLGVYWMRELATTWLYLVGDDEGGTSSDSNNGGLGYLVTPEGTDSGSIESFTEQARALIKQGTGAYTIDGTVKGSYVFGDSFIESGSTSNAYAGIFILVATSVPYDTALYGITEGADGNLTETALTFEDGVLPLAYVVEYGPTLEDCVTIRQQIEDTLLSGKQSAIYEEKVNAFGVATYQNNISYNKDAYKSLWKDLD